MPTGLECAYAHGLKSNKELDCVPLYGDFFDADTIVDI